MFHRSITSMVKISVLMVCGIISGSSAFAQYYDPHYQYYFEEPIEADEPPAEVPLITNVDLLCEENGFVVTNRTAYPIAVTWFLEAPHREYRQIVPSDESINLPVDTLQAELSIDINQSPTNSSQGPIFTCALNCGSPIELKAEPLCTPMLQAQPY